MSKRCYQLRADKHYIQKYCDPHPAGTYKDLITESVISSVCGGLSGKLPDIINNIIHNLPAAACYYAA